ncbi:MAG: hypothetical protein BMS9Abin05_0140 [Rhodothermia bacterium]|nr:MAG: hypothetical protein BMS9Abin05_0140 [Rhodothermia bacterium]
MKSSPAREIYRIVARTGFILLFAGNVQFSNAQESEADPNVIVDPLLFADLDFRMVGPTRGGRATAVAGHGDQPYTFYFGATGGGVWKTTDAGQNWANISDGFFETGSIGAIDVADSNPDLIYVGTGSEAIRSNVILGKGIYRSSDAGETWEHIGLHETGQIGAVVIHPTNPEVVYVAALGSPFGSNPKRGVYKTVNGGKSWELVLYVSSKTGAVDLELNPANPDEVYAALWFAERKPWTIISGDDTEDGIYKSTDAGRTWKKVENGLPQGLVGKIDLAVSPDDPSRIYALVEAKPDEEGLYRSNDRGESWYLVNAQKGLMNRPFYYTNVDADPTNADIVYVNNERFYKSVDAGQEFSRLSTPHGDNHDMWINPNRPEIMIQSNDGGANVSLNGGKTWSTQRNQATAELYQVNVDDRFPYRLYAGQQDNSTIAVPSLPPRSLPGGSTAYWEAIGGCETGPAVPKPGDENIVYSNCKGRFARYNRATGQAQQYYVGAANMYGRNPAELSYRFQRVAPIRVSPHDPNVIYHGSQYVHRTRDEGRTWETISPDLTAFRAERQMVSGGPITRDITGEEHYSALYTIEESPVEQGVIWTGANDGPVHVSRDDGATWTDVTPSGMPPEGRIQNIEPSPFGGGKAYLAGYRYLLNDFRPYIFRTTDYGASWTLLTSGENGIPDDYPTRVVREDPDREGLLYAGTEFGLFISFDDGAHWQSFQLDLPVVPVTDIKVHQKDLVPSTMGRSFWILDNLSPLHQINEHVANSKKHLFQSRDAYRVRMGGTDNGKEQPQYPDPGVQVDYYLSDAISTPLVLDVLDSTGSVLMSISSENRAAESAEKDAMRGPDPESVDQELSTDAGMHRFTWDMRYAGAVDPEDEATRGPLAVPGRYTIRLTAGAWTAENEVRILIDPRVAADGVTQDQLEAQLALNLKVRDLTSEANRVVAQIDSTLESLEDLVESENRNALEVKDGLDRIHAELVTDESDSYPPPMLLSQLKYLRGMTSSADQAPGQDAYTRYEELRDAVERWVSELDDLIVRTDELIGEASD